MRVMTPMMFMARAFTSVPVKPETLQRLRQYKVAGKTYDDVLNDFMDDVPTEAFWKEHARRLQQEERLRFDPTTASLSP